jgi:hypothetical protein
MPCYTPNKDAAGFVVNKRDVALIRQGLKGVAAARVLGVSTRHARRPAT